MNHRGLRAATLAGAALVLALASAACSSTVQPTPIYVVGTPPASATDVVATPTPVPTALGTITPWPSLPPTPTPGPVVVPTAKPTPIPSAGPTSPAAFCTGAASNQPTFVLTAHTLKFAVYCPTLGKGWSLSGWSFNSTKQPGFVKATYKGPSSASVEIDEGAFCLAPAVCSPSSGSLGAGSFGGLSGTLYNTAASEYSIYVAPGTKGAYQILGHRMSQATLVGIAAGLKVIPKT